jgi:hypothetical protein
VKATLINGTWRDSLGENAEFWRCSQGTIFCGGQYRPSLGLCTNCRTLRYHQKSGQPPRRYVFKVVIHQSRRNNRFNGGGALKIAYLPSLFQSRKRLEMSYARVLYERVMRTTLPASQSVVVLSNKSVPDFHDLVVVPRGRTSERCLSSIL